MNIEKSYLLGEVVCQTIDDHLPELSIVDRPPGATDVFIGIGIIVQFMEETPAPKTLSNVVLAFLVYN